jgi:hypothetical protein
MSSKNDNINQKLCYECAVYHEPENIQNIPCTVCRGHKCFIHGGKTTHSCKSCKTENLCSNCAGFARCCHEFDTETKEFKFVGREIIILKNEMAKLEEENRRLKLVVSEAFKFLSSESLKKKLGEYYFLDDASRDSKTDMSEKSCSYTPDSESSNYVA